MEKIIWEMYSRKKSRGPAADGSDPDAMEVASKSALEGNEASAVEKIDLPLFESGSLPDVHDGVLRHWPRPCRGWIA